MSSDTLKAAMSYADRGWSLLPIRTSEKLPAVPWTRYQCKPASGRTLRNWFQSADHGVGVILGSVSGDLVSRDFDDLSSYQDWADEHPRLAGCLPTVRTSRGVHIYATTSAESVLEARRRLGKPEHGKGALQFTDGELRAGVGCYNVLPPSKHPSGLTYAWQIPLPEGDLPVVDLSEAGFLATPITESTELTEDYRDYRGHRVTCEQDSHAPQLLALSGCELTVEEAIRLTLPSGPGQRHQQVFELARALKAVPELVGVEYEELKPHVREWHRRALPQISTKPFSETWIDFVEAWPKVRYARGADAMQDALERACSSRIPVEAEEVFEGGPREAWLLMSLCRELQRDAGDGPFFLSCRKACEVAGLSNHVKANQFLRPLERTGLLEVVKRGDNQGRKANRYRYLGSM